MHGRHGNDHDNDADTPKTNAESCFRNANRGGNRIAISESLSPRRRPPHLVCLLLFRLFITIVVIIIIALALIVVVVAVVVLLFTSTFNLRQSMPKREFGA